MTDLPIALVEEVGTLAARRRREDLVARLDAARARVADPGVRVVVAGEFKMGKSALVNALVGMPVCPVDDDIATAAPTLVRWSSTPEAWVTATGEPGAPPARTSVSYDDRGLVCAERGVAGDEEPPQLVELGVPAPMLSSGLQLIDTPGVGGLASVHNAATVAVLPSADAVLVVSDAAQELSHPELEFLRTACAACPVVVEVVSKSDFQPSWRRIVELDQSHVMRAGLEVQVVATSIVLHDRARQTDDAELDERSGLPELHRIIDAVVAGAVARRVELALGEARAALSQLAQLVSAERDGADPERAAAVLAELARARGRAVALNDPAAGWQVALDDGMTDLGAEIEFELAGRLRKEKAEAEERIAATDPADGWDEFAAWFEQQVMADVGAAYRTLTTGGEVLAGRVAELFAAAEAEVGSVLHTDTAAAVAPAHLDAGVASRRLGAGRRGVMALEGSWSGIEAFSMVGGLVGLSLINPLSLVLGLFMGRRVLREEKQRQLASRREQARQSVSRYLDEVTFRVAKDVQDALRRIHRGLRTSFAATAAEIARSIEEASIAAEQARAAQGTAGARDRAALDAELSTLDDLAGRIDAVRGA